MRYSLVVLLLLAGCSVSVRMHDPNLDGDCQQAKDLIAQGRPAAELNVDLPLPEGVTGVKGTVTGSVTKVAGIAEDDPEDVREQVMKAVTDRHWENGSNSSAKSNGRMFKFWTTYRSADVRGDVRLLPCAEEDIVVLTQQPPTN